MLADLADRHVKRGPPPLLGRYSYAFDEKMYSPCAGDVKCPPIVECESC